MKPTLPQKRALLAILDELATRYDTNSSKVSEYTCNELGRIIRDDYNWDPYITNFKHWLSDTYCTAVPDTTTSHHLYTATRYHLTDEDYDHFTLEFRLLHFTMLRTLITNNAITYNPETKTFSL